METDHVVSVSYEGIEVKLGVTHSEARLIAKYLLNEGLIKDEGQGVIITHKGIVEVEMVLTRPEKPTEHFPANFNIIYNTGTMTGTQQGNTESNQTLTITENQREGVLEAINQLKEMILKDNSLEADKKEELNHELSLAEIETKAKKPKLERIMDNLTSAKNLAEGSASGIVFISKIAFILKILGF